MRHWIMLLAAVACARETRRDVAQTDDALAIGDTEASDTDTNTESDSESVNENEPDTDVHDQDPGDSTIDPVPCESAGNEGQCVAASQCANTETSSRDLCDGSSPIACCLEDAFTCSVSGAPGVCLDVADCPQPSIPTPGHCPGAASIQCCANAAQACDPEGAPLPNEGLVEEPWDPACPAGMVTVSDFCIDRYEASLEMIDDNNDPIGSWSPFVNPGDTRVRAMSVGGAIPQGYITADQAQEACDNNHKKTLCTNAQWLRACQGEAGNTYPYGADRIDGLCNDDRWKHPAIDYFGTNAAWIWSELGHRCISQQVQTVDPAGASLECKTEEGVFDMMGNLHEWTSDPEGTFRGGFYDDTQINQEGCLYKTTAHPRSHWDYSTGFRCCVKPLY